MKTRVNTIGTKRIVTGNANEVTKDEILLVNKSIDLVPVTITNISSEQLIMSFGDSVGARKVNTETDRPITALLNILQSGKTLGIASMVENPYSTEKKKYRILTTTCYDNKMFSNFQDVEYNKVFVIPLPKFEVGASISIKIINSPQ